MVVYITPDTASRETLVKVKLAFLNGWAGRLQQT